MAVMMKLEHVYDFAAARTVPGKIAEAGRRVVPAG